MQQTISKEEKIKAIYEEMANKEKTIGCKYLVYEIDEPDKIIEAIEEWINFTLCFEDSVCATIPTEKDYFKYYSIKEVIWHPVLIGDVLRQIRVLAGYALDNDLIKKSDFSNVIVHHTYRITQIWENFREPIEKQSEECIDYVYNFLSNQVKNNLQSHQK